MNLHHIPAMPYYKAVRQFAIAKGLRFLTIVQQREVRMKYEQEMKKLN